MPSDPSSDNTLIPNDTSQTSVDRPSRAWTLPPDLLSEAVRRLRARRGPIHPDLEAIVLACLAKEPDDRPRNADDLATRLAQVPVECGWTAARANAWWDANRPAAARISLATAAGRP